MASDLSALLMSSKNLSVHLSKPNLPSVHLSLDQVEAQSQRLVSHQPGTSNDTDHAYVSLLHIEKYNASNIPFPQLSSGASSCRHICVIQFDSPPQYLYNILATSTASGHRCCWLPPTHTRTKSHFDYRGGQEGHTRGILLCVGGTQSLRLGSQEKAHF
jgi:hypothetical protein